jgi:1-acyl-sn-glycerol-3-phosphate acyltransferase
MVTSFADAMKQDSRQAAAHPPLENPLEIQEVARGLSPRPEPGVAIDAVRTADAGWRAPRRSCDHRPGRLPRSGIADMVRGVPLPPLQDPPEFRQRLRGLSRGVPAAVFLMITLLVFNLLQTLSLSIRPFSGQAFRSFNRWCANTWWGWCVILSERLQGIRIQVTGDPVPVRENAVVISNHQQMTDITFLMIWARRKERLGDMKWILKDVIKYVPGVGWGMLFLDCLYVKRNWSADRASVERTFARLVRNRVPVWLMSFPEGTRSTPAKLERSRAYAASQGMPPLEHLLIPRTKGFVATVRGLGDHVAAVYDVTIGYERGVPTLWQFVKGSVRLARLHVRRFPVASLPADDAALTRWLHERYQEKDRLLSEFYRHGTFPA